MTTPMLKIETLGPLRDTNIELGNVTFLVGEPNTGKSYILRSLYASMLYLDPATFGYCLATYSDRTRMASIVDVKVDEAKIREMAWFEDRKPITGKRIKVEIEGVTICIDLGSLLAESNRALERCIFSALLPPGSKYALIGADDTCTVFKAERVLTILKDIAYDIALKLVWEGQPLVVSSQEGARLCIRMQKMGYVIRVIADREDILRAINVEENVKRYVLLRFSPWRLLVETSIRLAKPRGRIVYATYARSLLVQALLVELLELMDTLKSFLLKRIQLEKHLKELIGIRNLPALSLYHALAEGYKLMLKRHDLAEKLIKMFGPLLKGRVKLIPGAIVYSSDDVEVPLHFASALAGEAVGLMLASAPILHAGKGWLLVEEPEAQLHPMAQAIVPVILYGLACEGVRLVVTTHSDIVAGVAAILASMAKKMPEKLYHAVKRLIDLFGKVDEENTERLARAIAEKLPRLDIRFYHVGNGKAKLKTVEEVVNGIPTLTETLWRLARWDLETL